MTLHEEIALHVQGLEAAATLLRRLPCLMSQEDGQPAANAQIAALAKVTAAERWIRLQVQDVMDELQDQDITARADRTAATVSALVAGMREAVSRLPDGPED